MQDRQISVYLRINYDLQMHLILKTRLGRFRHRGLETSMFGQKRRKINQINISTYILYCNIWELKARPNGLAPKLSAPKRLRPKRH